MTLSCKWLLIHLTIVSQFLAASAYGTPALCNKVVKAKPRLLRQCGSTCFLEAAVSLMESHLTRASKKSVYISRTQLLALWIESRLNHKLEGPTHRNWEQAFQKGASDQEIAEISFFANGGKPLEVVQMANFKGLPLLSNPNWADFSREQDSLDKLVQSVERIYGDYGVRAATMMRPFAAQNLTWDNFMIVELMDKMKWALRLELAKFLPKFTSKIEPFQMQKLSTVQNPGDQIAAAININRVVLISYFQGDLPHSTVAVGYSKDKNGKIVSLKLQHSWGIEGDTPELTEISARDLAKSLRVAFVLK